jgi:probable DNA metabolism protein
MTIFIYDRTFVGFLSAVFYAYNSKIFPDKITGTGSFQDDLFSEKYVISTDPKQAKRVWAGIRKRTSKLVCQKVYRVFLSEIPDIEILLLKFIKLVFSHEENIDGNYGDDTVLEFNNTYLRVCKEAHRAVMFIRFQKTADGIYYAPFDPEYNVLPLTLNHFKDRFADQRWIIYDTRRNYGYYYDLESVSEIRMPDLKASKITGKISAEIMDGREIDFQDIWNDYYKSTTIKERKNLKAHRQFLPTRYWKYLPEKKFK